MTPTCMDRRALMKQCASTSCGCGPSYMGGRVHSDYWRRVLRRHCGCCNVYCTALNS